MARQAAERIVRDGKDAGEVVRRVRALFKRAALEMHPVHVTEIIDEVLTLLERELSKRRVAVTRDLAVGLPAVIVDRVQIQHLLFNLCLHGVREAVTRRFQEGARRRHGGMSAPLRCSGVPRASASWNLGELGTPCSTVDQAAYHCCQRKFTRVSLKAAHHREPRPALRLRIARAPGRQPPLDLRDSQEPASAR
jgi:hypothetical protein